ncbi:uncharacterized protein A4U43_C06F7250 [Asparagus officinalis]|uniref:Uncharacterized protein n=1 Tax=Asparagus officinalis TaxID=4686 RepID=A0A5P1EP91_ASPOF|nr:uncharacterized protein A4U43_C06F7250 [Asparagus officinalis]
MVGQRGRGRRWHTGGRRTIRLAAYDPRNDSLTSDRYAAVGGQREDNEVAAGGGGREAVLCWGGERDTGGGMDDRVVYWMDEMILRIDLRSRESRVMRIGVPEECVNGLPYISSLVSVKEFGSD